MATQISPGVVITETDRSESLAGVALTEGGIAGPFAWGPILDVVTVSSETDLVSRFGKPTNDTAGTFFTAANFLSYSGTLRVVRAANTVALNASESRDEVTILTLTENGAGYIQVPTVTFEDVDATVNAVAVATLQVVAASISEDGGGSGYAVNDVVTVVGGDGTKAKIKVLTVDGLDNNAVTGIQIVSGSEGSYTELPAGTIDGTELTEVSTAGGTGSGLKVTLSFGVKTVTLLTKGAGYTEVPDVTVELPEEVTAPDTVATATATIGEASGVLIKNENHYESLAGTFSGQGLWAAKYAGALGNSLRVEVCASADAFRFSPGDAITASFNNTTVTFSTSVDSLSIGDTLIVGSQKRRVTAVDSATECTISTAFNTTTANNSTFTREWKYAGYFSGPPTTSPYVEQRGATNDELHIVVVDETGNITGTANTVLERYEGLSKAVDAKDGTGAVNYYPKVINAKSAWLWFLEHPLDGAGWGTSIADVIENTEEEQEAEFSTLDAIAMTSLSGGNSGEVLTEGQKKAAYDLFLDERVEVSFILGGDSSAEVSRYLASDLVDPIRGRKYTMAFISPERSDVVDNVGDEVEDIIAFREIMPSTSYAVLDSGWKYQYDRYNEVYRYVPLNGDIAGLAARTDQVAESWFSPAGFTRGQLKIGNTVKLAWNPKQSDRDSLYLKGINPVVSFPGEGTVLFGDKTMQTKPSAFDRINVRRLFIVLEKTIDRSAKYQLFEQNDQYTRNNFINLVEPFLRSVKGRRGISDFYVVCDETNNPQDAIDRNEFRADIYVKPVRSINFIQLNFVAVRSDVAFNEVVTNLS